jgi:hypothetical protein
VGTARLRHAVAVGSLAVTVALIATTSLVGGTTPRGSQRMQLGLDSFVAYHCQDVAAYEQDARTQVGDDKALGANSIAFAFPIYMPSLTSDVVAARLTCYDRRFESPPIGLLTKLVAIAHHAGLAVLLRPLVDLTSPGRRGGEKGWRGIIAPADADVWFGHYWTAVRPYLAMAQADHVEHVAIASELDSIAAAPQWTALIAKARSVYTGDLVFDYSWNTSEPKSWKSHATRAVDAYPNLSDGASGQTSTQLLAQWNGLLATNGSYAIPDLSTVAVDEVGILAQVGAYLDPAASSLPASTHPFNQSIQVRWFTTACAFAKQHHLPGLYFWGAWLSRNGGSLPSTPSTSRPSDIQPATQAAIRKCFA